MASRPSPAPTLAQLHPMLLWERETLPLEPGWLYEIKYNGYRLLATTGVAPLLKSRHGANATKWFPELVNALSELPTDFVLDGEVCVLDDVGRSDFERLRTRAQHRGWYQGADLVVYCVFGLLVARGKDLRLQPIERRKAELRRLLGKPSDGLLYVDSVEDGEWLSGLALRLGLEGVVGKRGGSAYRSGERSHDWVKVNQPAAVSP